ncbi:MAG: FHA domain-containing protein, partial [Aureliella sp.]
GTVSLPIDKSVVLIGRAEFCDICPTDRGVSRNHAELICHDGVLKVFDLESTNGTFVNGKRVKECELHMGDILAIAGTKYFIDSHPRGLWERLILAARKMVHGQPVIRSAAPGTFASLSASV